MSIDVCVHVCRPVMLWKEDRMKHAEVKQSKFFFVRSFVLTLYIFSLFIFFWLVFVVGANHSWKACQFFLPGSHPWTYASSF